MKSPAFQFYVSDFLIGVSGMSDEDVGVYIKMLGFQWDQGGLPICPKSIKKLINSRKIPSEIVLKKFKVSDDGFLKNERLEKEREKQVNFRESRSNNAKSRWDKTREKNARASGSISKTDALQLSSSSSDNPVVPKRDEALEVVEEWNRQRLPHWKECKYPDQWKEEVRKRLKKPFWRDNWREALALAVKSPSLQTYRGWRPNLEWFLYDGRKRTVASILEGKFDFDPDLPLMPSATSKPQPTINRSLDDNPYEATQA